jgi:hypothetical protein
MAVTLTYSTPIGDTVTVNGYSGSGSVVIPAKDDTDTYRVIGIDASAFLNANLTSLDMTGASNLESIGESAFHGWPDVTGDLVIPNSVKSIGNSAFTDFHNNNGGTLTIGTGVTTIGAGAFQYGGWTGTLIIPNNVIGDGGAFGATKFTSVIIGTGITSIRIYGFAYNPNLTSVSLPSSIISIEGNAFSGCTSLAEIIIPNSVTSIGSNAFDGDSSLVNVRFLGDHPTVGTDVFLGCAASIKGRYNPVYNYTNPFAGIPMYVYGTVYSNGTGGGYWADTSTWMDGVVPVDGNVIDLVTGDAIFDAIPVGITAASVLTCRGGVTINDGVVTTNTGGGFIYVNTGTVLNNISGAVVERNNAGGIVNNKSEVSINEIDGIVNQFTGGTVLTNHGTVNIAEVGATVLGTNDGTLSVTANAFTNPVASNVATGTSYKFNGTTISGTMKAGTGINGNDILGL